MKSLTPYQANRTRVEVMTVRRELVGPEMKSLTLHYQANRTMEVMMKMDPAVSDSMKSLTSFYQIDRTRIRVIILRREPAGSGM